MAVASPRSRSPRRSDAGATVLVVFLAALMLAALLAVELAINVGIAAGLIWAAAALFGTAVPLTWKTAMAGGLILYIARMTFSRGKS